MEFFLNSQIKCIHYALRGCESANSRSYMCTVPWNPILDKFCFGCDSFRERIHGPPDGSHFFTRGSCSCSSKRRLKIGFMSMWCFTVLKTENLGRKRRNKKPFSKFICLSRIEQHLVGFTLNKKKQSVQTIHILSLIAAVLIWLVICFFTFDIFLWFHCTCKKLYQIIKPQGSGRTKKNMWTTTAHHLWRRQIQLVTPKPDGLQQGWMTSIPGCNLVKIGKSTSATLECVDCWGLGPGNRRPA